MTNEELKETFKEAADVAKTVPESMQDAAFRRALDEFLGTSTAGSRSGTRRKRSRGRNAGPGRRAKTVAKSKGAKQAKGGTSRRPGPKTAVEDLLEAGYFKQSRTIGDIRARLATKKAKKYTASDLSPTLGRLLREGKLDREKNAEGQYEYTGK